ncbi:MAG: hypothetical protein M1825_005736 [Sarcosagium campestre]|nr:MAG: hypothetical protein M1825_005736 [Sarcosagium campestre]
MAHAQTRYQSLSLYRSFLRELPIRPLSAPSPLRQRLRSSFADGATTTTASAPQSRRLEEAQQMLTYVRAQRSYISLLERYNPGMTMGEEERLEATARRVGMQMPDDPRRRTGDGNQ